MLVPFSSQVSGIQLKVILIFDNNSRFKTHWDLAKSSRSKPIHRVEAGPFFYQPKVLAQHLRLPRGATGVRWLVEPTHLKKYASKWVHLPQGSGGENMKKMKPPLSCEKYSIYIISAVSRTITSPIQS